MSGALINGVIVGVIESPGVRRKFGRSNAVTFGTNVLSVPPRHVDKACVISH